MSARPTPQEWIEIPDVVEDDGVRRNHYGHYLIVPPDGGKPVGYRRVTTVAKALDTEGALVPWAQSRVLRGVVGSPVLLRRLRRLLGGNGDPWYDSPESKKAFKALIADLAEAGGTSKRRDRGTYLHAVAQRSICGLPQSSAFDDTDAAWLEQYHEALTAHGVVIDPDLVEQIVVHDGLRIAGKADYLRCRVAGFTDPMVGDLKTGESLEYAIDGYVMQLAIYASADALYVQGDEPDGSLDRRLPMPERDLKHALLIHAPQSGAPVTFHVVDVEAGLKAFALALEVEQYRKAQPAVEVLDADFTRQLAESVVIAEVPRLRAWLQGRIDVVGGHAEARAWLARSWPSSLPTLRSSDDHSPAQLAEIEHLLDVADARFGLPFGDPRPTGEHFDAVAALVATFPGSTLLS